MAELSCGGGKVLSWSGCGRVQTAIAPSAQNERLGDAEPVSVLLGRRTHRPLLIQVLGLGFTICNHVRRGSPDLAVTVDCRSPQKLAVRAEATRGAGCYPYQGGHPSRAETFSKRQCEFRGWIPDGCREISRKFRMQERENAFLTSPRWGSVIPESATRPAIPRGEASA